MQAVQNQIPYPNSPQRSLLQPGFQRSLSGSETDVSTSTENLTTEEKNVLRSGVRQEPQGEETLTGDADGTASNTLIIHNNSSFDGYMSPFYSQSTNDIDALQGVGSPRNKEEDQVCLNALFRTKMNCNTNLPKSNRVGSGIPPSPSPKSRRTHFPAFYSPGVQTVIHQLPLDEVRGIGTSPVSHLVTSSGGNVYSSTQTVGLNDNSVQEITDIPKHYLDQSEVLKHLAKEMHHQQFPFDLNALPPPPEYPKWQLPEYHRDQNYDLHSGNRRGGFGMGFGRIMGTEKRSERLSVSRSHPDLTLVGKLDDGIKFTLSNQRPKTHGRAATDVDSETCQTAQMIEILSRENAAFKSELDMCHRRVSKLEKLELEIQKVHQAHEELVRSSEKREKLEKAMRLRLEMEVRRFQDYNRELREQLDAATAQLTKRPLTEIGDSELRKELSKREVLIAQLLTQSKELLAEKDRQEIELQAQRATLQEQRNHIDILDNALTNAQANVVKLEEESRKKQAFVERVNHLQRALANLQLASDRRLQMEKKVRTQLEREIEMLKSQKSGQKCLMSKNKEEDTGEMKKTIREYEEKLIALEAEVAKWEQRYLEESTMRQIAVDAASVPKDAKIAALERTSQESEKLIAQARSEKLKHMDELYAAQRKCAELEGKMKDLESKLAERDAMIKVLQQRSQEKDAVLQNAVLGRPPRHTRAASTVGLTTSTSHTTTTTGVSSLGTVSSSSAVFHHRGGSKDGTSPITSSESSMSRPPTPTSSDCSLGSTKKSLDDQLKTLDSRLSRFNHKRSTSRERKISESLLESVKWN